jgi:hypothetical protein
LSRESKSRLLDSLLGIGYNVVCGNDMRKKEAIMGKKSVVIFIIVMLIAIIPMKVSGFLTGTTLCYYHCGIDSQLADDNPTTQKILFLMCAAEC